MQPRFQGENQYADITIEYKKSKMLPFRTLSETPTFMKVLGNDLGGKNIIDYACGEGHYTRKIRELTQGKVVGVDISPEMVELAQSQEDKEGTTIDYRVNDCCKTEFLEEFKEQFDVVTATYLLNYATNVEMI